MRNGFTLVELLAVIVILAVLALIATPVVLSIIDDTKESAMLRSAEMYLSGVENAVMRENMNNGGNFRPTSCEISNGNMICDTTNVEVEVEVDGEVPSSGSIVFENGKIKQVTLNYTSGTIIKDPSGNLVYEGSEIQSICTLSSDSAKAAGEYGAKYNCKVDPNKPEYTFYLINNNDDGTSDLIMNANINASGEAVISGVTEDKGFTAWDYAASVSNATISYGPRTAMSLLYNATKSWTNVEPLNYSYNVEQILYPVPTSYKSFVSNNGVGVLLAEDGTTTNTYGTSSEPLRARMPAIDDLKEVNLLEQQNPDKSEMFLYDNLQLRYGYYTLTVSGEAPPLAYKAMLYEEFWGALTSGDSNGVHLADMFGVRPIINVKL